MPIIHQDTGNGNARCNGNSRETTTNDKKVNCVHCLSKMRGERRDRRAIHKSFPDGLSFCTMAKKKNFLLADDWKDVSCTRCLRKNHFLRY